MNARASTTIFLPLTGSMRARIEATIEGLTALLDEIDGDADFEDEDFEDDDPAEEDDEDDGTEEEDFRELYEEWVRERAGKRLDF